MFRILFLAGSAHFYKMQPDSASFLFKRKGFSHELLAKLTALQIRNAGPDMIKMGLRNSF